MPDVQQQYDVIVIGGGVMGCATLHYLADLGVTDTLLIERDTLGAGSTGRSMTILRTHYSQAITTEMSLWSLEVMARFEDHTGGPSGFVNNGWMMLPERGLGHGAGKNHDLALECGVNSVMLNRGEASAKWPLMKFDAFDGVCWEPDSGYADSHLVTTSFAESATRRGATILPGCKVTAIRVSDNGGAVTVRTSNGDFLAEKVVVATGPWAADLLDPLGFDVPLTFARHQVVRLAQPASLSETAMSVHPTIASVPSGLAVRPDTPGTVLVGYREDLVHRDTYNKGLDMTIAAESIEILSRIFPDYREAGIIGGWAGVFTVTPDWNPVIDTLAGHENVVIGVGFSGHGFKMSPAVGLSLAELATESDATFDLRPLRYGRFASGDLLESSYGGTVFA